MNTRDDIQPAGIVADMNSGGELGWTLPVFFLLHGGQKRRMSNDDLIQLVDL